MMKKLYLLFLLSFILLACQQEKQNIIKGQIEGLKTGDRIILAVQDPDGSQRIVIDSVTVAKDGEFEIKTKITDNFIELTVLTPEQTFNPSWESPRFFLEGYDGLSVTGNVENLRGSEKIGGIYSHPGMQKYFETEKKAADLHNNAIGLRAEFRKNNDSLLYKKSVEMMNESSLLFKTTDSLKKEFVNNYPDVAYSAALIRYEYYRMESFKDFEALFNKLSPRVQASPVGVEIKTFIDNTNRSKVGAAAPDFTLKSLNGEEITLSNYKGKYVFLDFWGSWCAPCRQSSPKLVELYKQLKESNANIQFIGIACRENNDDNWKAAIEKDGLDWVQLNDSHSAKGKSIQKQYAADGVPDCIVISPEGEIIYRAHPNAIISDVKKLFGI